MYIYIYIIPSLTKVHLASYFIYIYIFTPNFYALLRRGTFIYIYIIPSLTKVH